jgi:enamine deaminase RidA (YjgF/YER057c/UK114 family)
LAGMKKRVLRGLEIVTLTRGPIEEHFVTATPQGDESPGSLFQRVGRAVHEMGGQVVSVEVLGTSAGDRKDLEILTESLDGTGVPVGWVENSRVDNLYGVHLWVVKGTPVERLELHGRRVGSLFEDDYARYCRVVGLLPADGSLPRPAQAGEILRQMEDVLALGGMQLSHVLRTWFYNDNILAWYGDFNSVRTTFFQEKRVFEGLLPASTGVGGHNATGGALIAGLIALQPKGHEIEASEVPSPMQSPAPGYGSSFSRAVELVTPDHRRIYVSGTASIDGEGETVFLGDTAAQVKQTMQVVQAILESRDMDWSDVVRSLAYFKRTEDAPLFRRYLENNAIPRFPAIVVENDICRDDLLFEIEVDAVKVK